MINVLISQAAKDDLDKIWDVDEDSAAEIETALEEISNDRRLADGLSEIRFRNTGTPSFEVDAFQALWRTGLNILRLKFWDWTGGLVPYRVLYAYHPQANTCYVLAVVQRNFNYETSHPIVARVCDDYKRLGLPSY